MYRNKYQKLSKDYVSATVVQTANTFEPVTKTQAKKQLEIAPSDTSHDSQIDDLIQAAREAFEHDTQIVTAAQTLDVYLGTFPSQDFQLPKRPILSGLTSIVHFDLLNNEQTVSTDIYSFDQTSNAVRLNYTKTWPNTYERWDAVRVRAVYGYTDADQIPQAYKQAMLLWIAYHFENRDMLAIDTSNNMRAYDNLITRFMRSTYP